jgi:inosose dehydratase
MESALDRRDLDRRDFARVIALGLGAVALPVLRAQPAKKVKIGVSTLAWNVNPNATDTFEQALKDISELGYSGFETVSPMIEALDANGVMSRLMEKYHIGMKAGYLGTNVTDPALRKDNVAKAISVGKLIKKYGGTYCVIAVNGRRASGRGPAQPDTFNFQEHRSNIVAGLNEYGMALTELGLGVGLHQHTGTVVETRDEVYSVMESVNTKYMKFAPDVGQLQKGGADAAKVVKDFAAITTHMHLKDYSNGKYMAGYCPLGMGVVDLESILKTLEEAGNNPDVMYELDRGNAPMSARDTAEFGKAHLIRLGYKFPMA